jgi:small subunit ribosomal protein S6
MYIVDPDLTDEQLEPIIAKYSKVVTDMGGQVVDHGKWEQGRRKLAYEIAGRREGIYLLMHFDAGTDVPRELDRIFRISDDALRHLIVRQDEDEQPQPRS